MITTTARRKGSQRSHVGMGFRNEKARHKAGQYCGEKGEDYKPGYTSSSRLMT